MSGSLHTNEIRITDDNREVLHAEAEVLGKRHVEALKEQQKRQEAK